MVEVHRANLIAVTPARAVPEELRSFVEFKATLKRMELTPERVVAIFLIDTTSCYVPVFLDKGMTLEDVRSELAEQDAEMPQMAENVIEQYLSRFADAKEK